MVLLFFDPTQRISKVDKQLCDYVAENYKPCVFVVNKWDLMADSMLTEKWVGYLHDTFRTMRYVPIAFITGQTGKNVKALLNHAQMLFKQSRQRLSTAAEQLCGRPRANPPPPHQNRRPRIFYATQVAGSRRRSCCSATSRGCSRRLSPLSAGRLSRKAPFAKCRSSSTCAAANNRTSGTRSTRR